MKEKKKYVRSRAYCFLCVLWSLWYPSFAQTAERPEPGLELAVNQSTQRYRDALAASTVNVRPLSTCKSNPAADKSLKSLQGLRGHALWDFLCASASPCSYWSGVVCWRSGWQVNLVGVTRRRPLQTHSLSVSVRSYLCVTLTTFQVSQCCVFLFRQLDADDDSFVSPTYYKKTEECWSFEGRKPTLLSLLCEKK